jgi:hypothetical protein
MTTTVRQMLAGKAGVHVVSPDDIDLLADERPPPDGRARTSAWSW